MDLLQRVREKLAGCGANRTEDDLRWAMQEVGLEMAEESCLQSKNLKRSGAEVQRGAAYQQGQQQEESSSPCHCCLETHPAQTEYNWPIGKEEVELFDTDIEDETPQSLQVSLTEPDVMPDITQDELVSRDWYRRNLWWETLRLEQELDGKFVPSLEEKFWMQFDLRLPYLGEMPQEEWEEELHDLVETEMGLDESYRALAWYAAELCPWLKNGSPTEGYDYNGPGLMFENMRDDPSFGSSARLRRKMIQDIRELYLPDSLGLREDLDYLILQEWELEQAYEKLFYLAWQYAPRSMDTHESLPQMEVLVPRKNAGSLCMVQATPGSKDTVQFRHLSEAPTKGQSMDNSCPTPLSVPVNQPGESSKFPSQPLSKQVQTGDLMDFWGEAVLPEPLSGAPTEDPGTINVCSLHVSNTRPKEEGPSFLQVASQELSLTAVELCLATVSASDIQEGETQLPQPLAEEPVAEQSTPDFGPMSREETALNKELKSLTIPAEALASGQRTSSFCPTPPVTLDCLADESYENHPQQLSLPEHLAEKPTEGQKIDIICSAPTTAPDNMSPVDPLEDAKSSTESRSERGTFPTYSGPDQVEVWCLGSLSPRGKNCDGMAIPLATLGAPFPMLLSCSCA